MNDSSECYLDAANASGPLHRLISHAEGARCRSVCHHPARTAVPHRDSGRSCGFFDLWICREHDRMYVVAASIVLLGLAYSLMGWRKAMTHTVRSEEHTS